MAGARRQLGENGVSSFGALQDALSRGASKRLVYFVFDLLFLDGRDLRELPLLELKTELAQLIKRRGRKGGPIRYSSHVVGNGAGVYRQACKMHLEGIVSKLWKAPYRSDRHRRLAEVGGGRARAALPPGRPPRRRPKGREIGLRRQGRHRLHRAARPGSRPAPGWPDPARQPLRGSAGGLPEGRHLGRARLVAEVEFKTWTADRLLRAASFQGLQEDKPATEVTRDRPAR